MAIAKHKEIWSKNKYINKNKGFFYRTTEFVEPTEYMQLTLNNISLNNCLNALTENATNSSAQSINNTGNKNNKFICTYN